MMVKGIGMFLENLQIEGKTATMRLIEEILSNQNIEMAIRKVKSNKGAAGIDKIPVDRIESIFQKHVEQIKTSILNMTYRPLPVRRVYIPKPNEKLRPLGIPVVIDRVIQQVIAQKLSEIFDSSFSQHSYGFRPNRSAHDAMEEVLINLNDGYEWVIDLDIEKYFDTVNHDRLISILREKVNDKITLNLIRKFLRAGIMDEGVVSPSEEGVPQGGPLSPILSNIYLDKLDKELEERGLRFIRYADDVNIFVKSEMSANRVMKSVTSWLERKLYLKVSATKTKVVKPLKSQFLGFTFWKNKDKWECKPCKDRKQKLCDKIKEKLTRRKAMTEPLSETFRKVNQILRGWINYFKIGVMKTFLEEFGQWLRHKIRVVIVKQWKKPLRIYTNLLRINQKMKYGFSEEDIFKVANTRKGIYAQCNGNVINFILNPTILAIGKGNRPGLVNPLEYYLIGRQK